jgi:hypothetical protein
VRFASDIDATRRDQPNDKDHAASEFNKFEDSAYPINEHQREPVFTRLSWTSLLESATLPCGRLTNERSFKIERELNGKMGVGKVVKAELFCY